eukprot:5805274-Lingulodinium_polyedra.AAC.1
MWDALGSPSENDVLLAKLLHQVSYLLHTMEGRAVLGVRRAVNMLVSKVRKGCTSGTTHDTGREPG